MENNSIGKIVIYTRHLEDLKEIIMELHKTNIDVTLESCEKCMVNLERCILDTLQETRPDVVLIENDSTNNGMLLYKMIKEEGTLENIPVLFIGINNEEYKLEALGMGALDYIQQPFSCKEVVLKVKNHMDIGKRYSNNSIYDNMTGIYVRSYGEENAKNEFKIAKQYKRDFTLLAVDIDNMTNINSTLGKFTGDNIIKECIDIFRGYLRDRDFIYRYSGQRFILVFENKNASSVFKLSESLLERVSSLSEKHNAEISFTGGIVSLNKEDKEFKELLAKGFKSLENGKLNGRGKVYINESSLFNKLERSILILDDDSVILSILSSRYKNKGYRVFTAEDLDEARKVISNEDVDLVITDYIVPGITGIELIKGLKELKRNLKIIILSSQRNERIVESALKSGADDYLIKPFSPIELDSRLSKLID